uniref:Uncharacterized protein n=1 Tax=Solanum lycopersicum TaxID=4081 RepID=A0A3Q7IYF5_SOLLC
MPSRPIFKIRPKFNRNDNPKSLTQTTVSCQLSTVVTLVSVTPQLVSVLGVLSLSPTATPRLLAARNCSRDSKRNFLVYNFYQDTVKNKYKREECLLNSLD